MKYYPMLASQGYLTDLAREDLVFEPKLDGIRCIAVIARDSVQLFSRTGKDITAQFPEVVGSLSNCDMPLVLDGEIIVRDLDSEYGCDFQLLQTRLQRKEDVLGSALEAPAEFTAFDLLEHGRLSTISLPWWHRRDLLDYVCQKNGIRTTTCMDAKAATSIWQDLIQSGCEGMMAKDRESLYVPGTRSKSWLKIKPMLEGEFVVGGITHGYGRRKELFGGLVLGEYQRDLATNKPEPLLTFVGVVGSGLTDVQMHDLFHTLLRGRASSPFFNWAAIDDVKHWVEPEYIAKVKFQEWTRDKKLRFPTLLEIKQVQAGAERQS